MKVTRVAVALLMAVALVGVAPVPAPAAQQASAPVDAEEAEHEALRQLRALYERSVRDNKIEAMAPFLHQDFHGVMVTGRQVNGFGELQRYWSDIHALMGEGGRYTTTLNPETSVLLGDVALARGSSDDVVVTGDGQEFRFNSYWTAVLQKDDGSWKLRRVQGSIDPVDNPFVREFTRRALRWTGAVSGGVGLLLGLGIAWVAARRRGRRV